MNVLPEQVADAIQRVFDRSAIQDTLARYARAVDRGLWAELREVYHDDAYDDHVEYRGDVTGLIAWLDERFSGVENSMHLLGNCLIEFAGHDLALVETYFVSQRLRAPTPAEPGAAPGDAIGRQSCGRYIDRFERRGGEWRIAHRRVVLDARFSFVAEGGARDGGDFWGTRDGSDPLHAARALVLEGRG